MIDSNSGLQSQQVNSAGQQSKYVAQSSVGSFRTEVKEIPISKPSAATVASRPLVRPGRSVYRIKHTYQAVSEDDDVDSLLRNTLSDVTCEHDSAHVTMTSFCVQCDVVTCRECRGKRHQGHGHGQGRDHEVISLEEADRTIFMPFIRASLDNLHQRIDKCEVAATRAEQLLTRGRKKCKTAKNEVIPTICDVLLQNINSSSITQKTSSNADTCFNSTPNCSQVITSKRSVEARGEDILYNIEILSQDYLGQLETLRRRSERYQIALKEKIVMHEAVLPPLRSAIERATLYKAINMNKLPIVTNIDNLPTDNDFLALESEHDAKLSPFFKLDEIKRFLNGDLTAVSSLGDIARLTLEDSEIISSKVENETDFRADSSLGQQESMTSADLVRTFEFASQAKSRDIEIMTLLNDRLLLSALASRHFYVYSATDGRHLATGEAMSHIYDVHWSNDGHVIYTSLSRRTTTKAALVNVNEERISEVITSNPRNISSSSSSDVLYLADWADGIFQSRDDGMTWSHVFKPTNGVQCLQVVKLNATTTATTEEFWTLCWCAESKQYRLRIYTVATTISSNENNDAIEDSSSSSHVTWSDVSMYAPASRVRLNLARSYLAYDCKRNKMFVSDMVTSSVHVYTASTGKYQHVLLTSAQIDCPWRLCVDSQRDLLYVGQSNETVKIFSLSTL